MISTVPHEPLSGGPRHPYSCRPSRVGWQAGAGRGPEQKSRLAGTIRRTLDEQVHDARVPLRNNKNKRKRCSRDGTLGTLGCCAGSSAAMARTRGLVAGSRTLLQATESAVLCPDETRARTRSEVLS